MDDSGASRPDLWIRIGVRWITREVVVIRPDMSHIANVTQFTGRSDSVGCSISNPEFCSATQQPAEETPWNLTTRGSRALLRARWRIAAPSCRLLCLQQGLRRTVVEVLAIACFSLDWHDVDGSDRRGRRPATAGAGSLACDYEAGGNAWAR